MKMTNLTTTLEYNNKTIRTVMVLGDPWFVAADVCKILALRDASQTLHGKRGEDGLDEDEKDTYNVRTLGGVQKMLCVNESGLYSLIFKSRKPEAKAFRKWVTSEVLPALRKDGFYSLTNDGSHEIADWELKRSRSRVRLLKLLVDLERQPKPGLEYLTVSEFLKRQGLMSLDKKTKMYFVRSVQRKCRENSEPPVRQWRSNSLLPTTLWPCPVLSDCANLLPEREPELFTMQ